ncbi:thioredoxin family protein [Mycobacterium parmense]|uniref:Thiol reductase thioredoxin n=1 Tax=Mycobacterium parmense TaxID=185642 RepID=A0A7I7YQU1_9MYCO|nr:thioredoxin family protein [Mycobacterium parmense]MCV7353814.1 thioredoxin family protein [Mycobacterium parmense]ORW58058.1 thioredoxin [Mycobacterium parmense]BBZ43313.1 thiol reductase thioredoxin [Mycobacterium parmense]
MSTLGIVVTAIVAALAVASVLGVTINRRSGALRATEPVSDQDTPYLGLSQIGPTVVHFSAVWCGPCASVRRVVDQVCAELPDVSHVEIDIDANPAAAKHLSVLSLPTTFVFDAEGKRRYRSVGVPTVAELRKALQSLGTIRP